MELAFPHVVVRIFGPGEGRDIVAALGAHPVEVTEVRSRAEARRATGGRPAHLVVMTNPPDPDAAISETWQEFPKTPILIVGGPTGDANARQRSAVTEPTVTRKGWVESIPDDMPLPDICWHIMEATSRACLLSSVAERPIGPVRLEVDDQGVVVSDTTTIESLPVDGRLIRVGDSLLPLVEPHDRGMFAEMLGRSLVMEAQFSTVRLLDGRGGRHAVAVGIRHLGAGRVALLVQPLIAAGPLVGRHINNRDPITGLLTRWAISRVLEEHGQSGSAGGGSALVVLKLVEFAGISEYIGFLATDVTLVRVASALTQVLTYPALSSRLMGDTFLSWLPETPVDDALRRVQQVIEAVGNIDVPGFAPGFRLRAAAGIAGVVRKDFDFAIRNADAAANAARSAGGNRAIIAESGVFTSAQGAELTAKMDLGDWELWLQPVVGPAGGQAVFHEALARFGDGRGHVVSRIDFFTAGRAHGLLERFDRMMLRRALQILASHPDAKLSVNVSLETFVSDAFPASFIELIREVPDGFRRVILEIAPYCLTPPATGVRPRLEALAAAGIAVALDDFGSGICRLQYLTQFPLAIVKLDELVTGYIDDDPLQREFVRTTASLCRARGIMIVAEYTRLPEQLKHLAEDGVDLFQGELFGMPAPAADVLAPPTVGASPA